MASLDGSKQTRIYLKNEAISAKFSTICSLSTYIYYPKEGVKDEDLDDADNWRYEAIPEVLTTTIVNGALVCEPYKETE